MIYTGATLSLAALEILANSSILPADYVFAEISIPDEVAVIELADSQLPDHWDSLVPTHARQVFGDKWVNEQRSAVLSVPSAIVPIERNFILNPAHPNFPRIAFSGLQPFIFNPRLR